MLVPQGDQLQNIVSPVELRRLNSLQAVIDYSLLPEVTVTVMFHCL